MLYINFIIILALSSMKPNVDSTNCILVQDVKAVTHDQMTQDSMSTQSPTEGETCSLQNCNVNL